MRSPRLAAVALGAVMLLVPAGLSYGSGADADQDPGTHLVLSSATSHARTSSFTAWHTNAGFDSGTHEGTQGAGSYLVMTSPIHGTTIDHRRYAMSRWTSAWVAPASTFTEVIPSWHASTPSGTLVQIRVRARTATGATSTFDTLGTWTTRDGEYHRTSDGAQSDDLASVATDTFRANAGRRFTAWQLRVLLLRRPGTTTGPTVKKVGAVASRPSSSLPRTSRPLYGARSLAVPKYSQMIHRGEYPQYGGGGEAWCSPTSTAMIMGYYKSLPSRANYAWVKSSYADRWVDHVARMTYDYRYRGTGNWPFNVAFANQYVADAFVTRLASLREAERFIHVGIPLAASISFARGQLTGAPISATNGHLVVIAGFTKAGNVIVNDPAARSNSSVRRTYDRGQFERAWLRKSDGLVYVIHDRSHPLPKRPAGTSAW